MKDAALQCHNFLTALVKEHGGSQLSYEIKEKISFKTPRKKVTSTHKKLDKSKKLDKRLSEIVAGHSIASWQQADALKRAYNICDHYGVTIDDVLTHRFSPKIKEAREYCIFSAVDEFGLSYEDAAQLFKRTEQYVCSVIERFYRDEAGI